MKRIFNTIKIPEGKRMPCGHCGSKKKSGSSKKAAKKPAKKSASTAEEPED